MGNERSNPEDLLRRVLTGELADDAPEVVELLAADPSAGKELERLRALTAELDDAAGFVDAVVTEASALERTPGESQVEQFLEARLGERSPRLFARLRPVLAAFIATAATVLILLWGWPPGSEVYLGEGDVELMASDDFERFTWKHELPANWQGELPKGWEYEVRILDATTGEILERSERLREPVWIPSVDTSEWPDTIEWKLYIHDNSGAPRLVGSAPASR